MGDFENRNPEGGNKKKIQRQLLPMRKRAGRIPRAGFHCEPI